MNPVFKAAIRLDGLVRLLVLLITLGFPSWRANAQSNYSEAYTFTTIAGEASNGSADGIGSAAQFFRPGGVTVDTNGNTYVADSFNNTIRKITSAGLVSTIAGFAGDGGNTDGANEHARFSAPAALVLDTAGNIYVADYYNSSIRKITPVGTNWIVSTIAGGTYGTNDGTGTNAQFSSPSGIAIDSRTNLYLEDFGLFSAIIRKISPVGTNWNVTTIAGFQPTAIACDAAGDLYLGEYDVLVKAVPFGTNWIVSTLAGSAANSGSLDGTNDSARFYVIDGVAVDSATNIYLADYGNSNVRKVTPAGTNWVVSTVAGPAGFENGFGIGFADGTGTNALFYGPTGVALDSADNIYVADTGNNAIRKLTPAGVVRTVAGAMGSTGSVDGSGSAARFRLPGGVTVDKSGNIYVADIYNDTIRQITSEGVVFTLVGLATNSGATDGTGSLARFNQPAALALDSGGNIYVADSGNSTIRKITPSGVSSTIAGSPLDQGYADGTNSGAKFLLPLASPLIIQPISMYLTWIIRRFAKFSQLAPTG